MGKLTLVALCAVLWAYNVRALPVEGNEVGEEHPSKICMFGFCCDREESIGEGLTVGEEHICVFGYCCKKEEKNLKEILAPSATTGIEVGENLCLFGYCCEKEKSTEDGCSITDWLNYRCSTGLNVGEEENICMFGYCCSKKKEAA